MMPVWLAGAGDGNGAEVPADEPLTSILGSRLLALLQTARMQPAGAAMANTTRPCGAPVGRARGLGEGSTSSTL